MLKNAYNDNPICFSNGEGENPLGEKRNIKGKNILKTVKPAPP